MGCQYLLLLLYWCCCWFDSSWFHSWSVLLYRIIVFVLSSFFGQSIEGFLSKLSFHRPRRNVWMVRMGGWCIIEDMSCGLKGKNSTCQDCHHNLGIQYLDQFCMCYYYLFSLVIVVSPRMRYTTLSCTSFSFVRLQVMNTAMSLLLTWLSV